MAGLPTTAGAPSYAYLPARDATAVARLRGGRGGRDRQDQPRPVRDRPGRHPQPVRRGPQRLGPGADLRRLQFRVGGRGGARPRRSRPRNGHGRLRSRPRRPERHRRRQAHAGRHPVHRRGAGLPVARLRDRVRAIGAAGPPGGRGDGGPRRRGPAGDPARRPAARRLAVPGPPGAGLPRRRRPGVRLAVPLPAQLAGLADGWAEAFEAAVARLRSAGAEVVTVDIAPLLEAASLLYGGSFVAERYTAVGDHVREHAELIGGDLDPVVATIILDAAKHSAADYFADRERLDRLTARAAGALDGCDALLTPTTTRHPTIAEVAGGPGRRQRAARDLHELREPARPRGPGRAGRDGRGAAVRDHADRPGGQRRAARRDRRALRPGRRRPAGRRRAPERAAAEP